MDFEVKPGGTLMVLRPSWLWPQDGHWGDKHHKIYPVSGHYATHIFWSKLTWEEELYQTRAMFSVNPNQDSLSVCPLCLELRLQMIWIAVRTQSLSRCKLVGEADMNVLFKSKHPGCTQLSPHLPCHPRALGGWQMTGQRGRWVEGQVSWGERNAALWTRDLCRTKSGPFYLSLLEQIK
jgi:hypothetical protein